MAWKYDSGGHKKDQQKYRENWERIFGKKKEEPKFAVMVEWMTDDWLYLTKDGNEIFTFESEEEAKEYTKSFKKGKSKVIKL